MINQMPINISLFKSPQCPTKSAFDRNFKANANSRKPKITLILFIHPPDLGIDWSALGKTANKANGKANAAPKPPIPTVSCIAPESEDKELASKDPKIGPVQENETIAKVSAIKKIPKTPPPDAAVSDLLPHPLGKVNS